MAQMIFFSILILIAQIASAQPVMPAVAPSGTTLLQQGCGYGSQAAKVIDIDQDEFVSGALAQKKDVDQRLRAARSAVRDAKNAMRGAELGLKSSLGYTGAGIFFKALTACEEIYKDVMTKGAAITAEKEAQEKNRLKTKLEQERKKKINETFKDDITTSNSLPAWFVGPCTKAIPSPEAFMVESPTGPQSVEFKPDELCGEGPGGTVLSSASWVPEGKRSVSSQICKEHLTGYLSAKNLLSEAEKTEQKLKQELLLAQREYNKAKTDRKKDIIDEQKQAREDYEESLKGGGPIFVSGGGAGGGGICATGNCGGVRVFSANNNMAEAMSKTADTVLYASLGSSLIQGLFENASSRRNRSLGYPTGPNMWINPAMNFANGMMNYAMINSMAHANYGYPFAGGNIAGAVGSGVGIGGLGCAQTIGSPHFASVGQNGNIFGPYAIAQGSMTPGMVGGVNQGGVFNPMINGQVGVVPTANGQVFFNQMGQPMVTCFTAPCNVGGIGNSPLGVGNGGGAWNSMGGLPAMCAAYPAACNGANNGGWPGSAGGFGPGASAYSEFEYMNALRRQQMGYDLQRQSYSLLNGSSGSFGYNGFSGGANMGYPYGGTGGVQFGISAGLNLRTPGVMLPPMASPGLYPSGSYQGR